MIVQRSRNGESPIVTQCRLGAADSFPSAGLHKGVPKGHGESPSALLANWVQLPRAGGDGGRSAGPGRSARPGAGLTAPGVSHRATGSPKRQVSPPLARWGLSAGLLDSVPSRPPVTHWQSLKAQQVSPPMISRGCARRASGATGGRASIERLPVSLTAALASRGWSAGPGRGSGPLSPFIRMLQLPNLCVCVQN